MLMFLIRLLLLSLLPTFLIYYGTDKISLPFGNNHTFSPYIKGVALVLGTLIVAIIVPFRNESDKRKAAKIATTLKSLFSVLRKSISDELATHLLNGNNEDLKLSIRIFTPQRRGIMDLCKGRRYFVLTNVDGLNIREVEGLMFQVSPCEHSQGLVGQAYCQKSVKYDFEINQNHGNEYYRLEPNQVDKTEYCNFAIAAPIFIGTSKKVKAIVTFDSDVKVATPNNSEWKDVIRKSCMIIHRAHNSTK